MAGENTAVAGRPTLKELLGYFVRLGTLGFGGPVVLCEHMRRDLVESRRWIMPEEYSEGFALSQLAPGPLAAQLAIYIGWACGGVAWATWVGIAFVLPSFLIVLGLAALYLAYGGLPWIQGAFYGVGSGVIAIMAISSIRLVTKTFKHDWLLWAVGGVSIVTTIWTESENLYLFLAAGVLVFLARRRSRSMISVFPAWLFTGLPGLGGETELVKLFTFFIKSGAVVFGSGLAIVPFLHSGVVLEHQWLNERQFLDSVAIAMITPGPVVITVAFIGFLVSGLIGAAVAALGVFLPCYLFVIIPAPYFRKFAQNKSIRDVVEGITAAAIGAIAGATVVLARRALIDWITISICLTVLIVLLRTKKIPEPILILSAGIVGVLLKTSWGFP